MVQHYVDTVVKHKQHTHTLYSHIQNFTKHRHYLTSVLMLNIFMPKYGTDICWHTRSQHAGYITQGMLNYAEVNTSLTTSFYLGHNQFCDNAYLWVTTFPPSMQHTAVSHCTFDTQLTLFSSALMVLTNTLLGSVPGTCFLWRDNETQTLL